MSDPFKDARIRRDRERREATAESYEPVVLWIETSGTMPEGMISPEEKARRFIRDQVDLPFVTVTTANEPASVVVTEFDEIYDEARECVREDNDD